MNNKGKVTRLFNPIRDAAEGVHIMKGVWGRLHKKPTGQTPLSLIPEDQRLKIARSMRMEAMVFFLTGVIAGFLTLWSASTSSIPMVLILLAIIIFFGGIIASIMRAWLAHMVARGQTCGLRDFVHSVFLRKD